MWCENDTVKQKVDALTFEASKRVLENWMVDGLRGEFGIVKQSAQALDFATLLSGKRHSGGDMRLMSGNGLRDANECRDERVKQTRTECREQLGKA